MHSWTRGGTGHRTQRAAEWQGAGREGQATLRDAGRGEAESGGGPARRGVGLCPGGWLSQPEPGRGRVPAEGTVLGQGRASHVVPQ